MKTIPLKTILIVFSFIFSVCFITKIFAEEKTASEPEEKKQTIIEYTDYNKLEGTELIKMAQRVLKDSGFDPGPVDGSFGPKTREATKNFQIKNRLEPTGELDEHTRDRLFWSY
jgi:peptidoglycan hydrolase-like protein with peptidoglycan-binding domain